ncbi:MAG TPA: cache domain-containing protein, partial [Candidatus Saccharimonadales bacterium]|nr:cache domain-containing protein [Candidatus Saccharimonadales bacterium]
MQKALSKIKNLQLTAKLIFYILFVIVLPFTLLYLLALRSLSNTSSTVETKSLEQTTALVSQQLINNVKATGQIYDLTFKRQAIDAQTIQDGVSAGNFSMNLLSDFSHKHQFISDAFFIDPSGRLYTFPSLAGAATKVDLSQAAGFNFTNPVSYAGRWVGPYNDFKSADKTNTISYVAPVWKGSQYLGAVGLDIAISKFFSIAPLDPAQSSYVFVVRKDGSIISSSDQIYKDFGANTQQSNDTLTLSKIPDKKLAGRLAVDSAGSVGTFRFQSTGDEKLVAFAPITAFEAKIFVASPYKAIIALQQEKAVQLQKAVRKVGTSGLVYL